MPFRIHKQIFKKDLLLCGANLSTGKTVLFSAKHTPNFPVADAVRISMSLPLVYKPYVLKKQLPGYPPCGTYVDGGIWNNLPFREIGNLSKMGQAAAPAKSPSASAPPEKSEAPTRALSEALAERTTLGLRLEITSPKPVLTGGDLMAAFLNAGMTAGESQVTADIEPFTLLLDTTGLDLLKFKPDEEAKNTVQPRSRRATYRYFGLEPPPADADAADDARVEQARTKTACG